MLKIWTNEKHVGSYGTFGNPIIELPNGDEAVCEEYYLDDNGNPTETVCQSRGCDFCSGHYDGCRNIKENVGRQTAYFYNV